MQQGNHLGFVELLGEQDGKAWRLFEEEKLIADGEILLGDEPLKGDEVQRP